MAHVLILGGGFGGLAAARELRNLLPDDEITLVAKDDRFYMGFAKLWDLAGDRPLDQGTVALSELEKLGIRFVHGEITSIDAAARRVETSGGTLECDAMLVALGADASPAHLNLLANDRSFNLYDGAALPDMREALATVDGGSVLVGILGGPYKCPPAPYEAALIVDELLRKRGARDAVSVAVSTPAPITLPVAGKDASQYVASHLADRDIELLAEHKITSVDAEERTLQFANGVKRGFGLLLGVPANVAPAVLQESGLIGDSGWIEPDRLSMRTAAEGVYAVGDCTAIPAGKGQLPKAGVFAAAEARVAARNIAADLVGGQPEQFDGHGFCYLELPGQQVAFVQGNWYAQGGPQVELTEADAEQFRRKQEYEAEHLREWFN